MLASRGSAADDDWVKAGTCRSSVPNLQTGTLFHNSDCFPCPMQVIPATSASHCWHVGIYNACVYQLNRIIFDKLGILASSMLAAVIRHS